MARSWFRLPHEQCDIFIAYVHKYRQDWIDLARSLDVLAASGLAHAMLMVSMPPDRLVAGDTPITSIIMKYIHVHDGNIRPNEMLVPTNQPHPAPSPSTVEAADHLAQALCQRGPSAGASERDTSTEERSPSETSDVSSHDPDETEGTEPTQQGVTQ